MKAKYYIPLLILWVILFAVGSAKCQSTLAPSSTRFGTLYMHFRADSISGINDGDEVTVWEDLQSSNSLQPFAPDTLDYRPIYTANALAGGGPVVEFKDQKTQFLNNALSSNADWTKEDLRFLTDGTGGAGLIVFRYDFSKAATGVSNVYLLDNGGVDNNGLVMGFFTQPPTTLNWAIRLIYSGNVASWINIPFSSDADFLYALFWGYKNDGTDYDFIWAFNDTSNFYASASLKSPNTGDAADDLTIGGQDDELTLTRQVAGTALDTGIDIVEMAFWSGWPGYDENDFNEDTIDSLFNYVGSEYSDDYVDPCVGCGDAEEDAEVSASGSLWDDVARVDTSATGTTRDVWTEIGEDRTDIEMISWGRLAQITWADMANIQWDTYTGRQQNTGWGDVSR